MRSTLALAAFLSCVGLTGCDTGNSKEGKPKGVIPEHQLETLEKAKGVEKKLLDAEKQRSETLE